VIWWPVLAARAVSVSPCAPRDSHTVAGSPSFSGSGATSRRGSTGPGSSSAAGADVNANGNCTRGRPRASAVSGAAFSTVAAGGGRSALSTKRPRPKS
jgi:hypothetical protein